MKRGQHKTVLALITLLSIQSLPAYSKDPIDPTKDPNDPRNQPGPVGQAATSIYNAATCPFTPDTKLTDITSKVKGILAANAGDKCAGLKQKVEDLNRKIDGLTSTTNNYDGGGIGANTNTNPGGNMAGAPNAPGAGNAPPSKGEMGGGPTTTVRTNTTNTQQDKSKEIQDASKALEDLMDVMANDKECGGEEKSQKLAHLGIQFAGNIMKNALGAPGAMAGAAASLISKAVSIFKNASFNNVLKDFENDEKFPEVACLYYFIQQQTPFGGLCGNIDFKASKLRGDCASKENCLNNIVGEINRDVVGLYADVQKAMRKFRDMDGKTGEYKDYTKAKTATDKKDAAFDAPLSPDAPPVLLTNSVDELFQKMTGVFGVNFKDKTLKGADDLISSTLNGIKDQKDPMYKFLACVQPNDDGKAESSSLHNLLAQNTEIYCMLKTKSPRSVNRNPNIQCPASRGAPVEEPTVRDFVNEANRPLKNVNKTLEYLETCSRDFRKNAGRNDAQYSESKDINGKSGNWYYDLLYVLSAKNPKSTLLNVASKEATAESVQQEVDMLRNQISLVDTEKARWDTAILGNNSSRYKDLMTVLVPNKTGAGKLRQRTDRELGNLIDDASRSKDKLNTTDSNFFRAKLGPILNICTKLATVYQVENFSPERRTDDKKWTLTEPSPSCKKLLACAKGPQMPTNRNSETDLGKYFCDLQGNTDAMLGTLQTELGARFNNNADQMLKDCL